MNRKIDKLIFLLFAAFALKSKLSTHPSKQDASTDKYDRYFIHSINSPEEVHYTDWNIAAVSIISSVGSIIGRIASWGGGTGFIA